MKKVTVLALMGMVLFAFAGNTAQAVVITPGSQIAAVADATGPVVGPSLGSTGPIAFSIGVSINGIFSQEAFANANNPFGAGLVTLVYNFSNNSPADVPPSSGTIVRMTSSDFTGVGVDIGWETPVGPLADTPDIFSRNTVDAIGVTWDVANLGAGAGVNPGESAATIVVHTDQPLVDLSGVTALINGGSVNFATFRAVPEPSAFLYGGMIAAVAGLGYRGRRWLAGPVEEAAA